MNNQSDIKRVTDPKEGPPDGVSVVIQGVLTQFKQNDEGECVITGQAVMPCHVFCAYSDGTIGFSMRDIELMITVRIDELYEILKAAGEAAQELQNSMPPEYTDAELEKRWDELTNILFDEADSPSGVITAEDFWIFPKGTDREDIWKHFDEHYSKGVAYLLGVSEW